MFQGALWPHLIRYAFDSNNDEFTRLGIPYSVYHYKKRLLSEIGITGTAPPGRLGQSVEGGGKRRIFAIGNWVNQRLLKPFHDWLMDVLRSLPTDGTFNQTKPLEGLVGEMHIFSFDLKSATDRWPLRALVPLVEVMFGKLFAWVAVL